MVVQALQVLQVQRDAVPHLLLGAWPYIRTQGTVSLRLVSGMRGASGRRFSRVSLLGDTYAGPCAAARRNWGPATMPHGFAGAVSLRRTSPSVPLLEDVLVGVRPLTPLPLTRPLADRETDFELKCARPSAWFGRNAA